MLATKWPDFYAECPFYRTVEGKNIICQGVTQASSLVWKFRRREDFEIQINTFCSDHYRNCEVYRMLYKISEEGEL